MDEVRSVKNESFPVVIIGGGPAGLTAAFQLTERDIQPLVLEQGEQVGGLARTEVFKDYRFDIGGHRFYTKVPEVQRLWEQMLGDDFLKVQRLSRIYYDGRFYHYPIEPFNALTNLGLRESILTLVSYLRSKLFPYPVEETFEQWVSNRFGRRLYRMFFKTYTEKVWGIPCNLIQSEFAAQRIKGLSLVATVWEALFPTNNIKSLIHEFHYPRLGPGMMWERFREAIEKRAGQVRTGAQVLQLKREGNRIACVTVRRGGVDEEIGGEHFISTMPLSELIFRITPPPPAEVVEAARGLHYRAFIIVELILNRENVFPDDWIYIHSPEVKVGRIQNFKNWSAAMVPDPHKTSLGMEFFCNEGDDIWTMTDVALIAQAARELAVLGLAGADEVEDGTVLRQPKAYPVYDPGYRGRLKIIRQYLASIENLQTLGRNGMHRYNNQDHSMLTGMLAVRNLSGETHDLWDVNTDRSYYEEFVVDETQGDSEGL